jgi:hypothetical protein
MLPGLNIVRYLTIASLMFYQHFPGKQSLCGIYQAVKGSHLGRDAVLFIQLKTDISLFASNGKSE